MSLFERPQCPNCGDRVVELSRSAGSLARFVAGLATAVFVGDVVALKWRCRGCGATFLARGCQSEGSQQSRGFPVVPSRPHSRRDGRGKGDVQDFKK